ncbi:MAG: YebC/PmpR family DNA-binding transcriptional regulator [Flavobacteriales bacterium]
MGRAFEYRKATKMARWSKMSKAFTKIGKEITMAVKAGGADPDSNLTLRRAMLNAKGVNMPKDNIERAIKKALGSDAKDYQEVVYEGYGPSGVAILVETATDNSTRTVANVRAIFNKHEGNLGTSGSLSFIFDRKGVFEIETSQIVGQDFEELELAFIDGGAEEVEKDEEMIMITTEYDDFGNMANKLEELNIEAKSSALKRFPTTKVNLTVEEAQPILKMLEKYENDDDVQNVYHNMEMTDEIIAAMQ